jgi:hypothetical protein
LSKSTKNATFVFLFFIDFFIGWRGVWGKFGLGGCGSGLLYEFFWEPVSQKNGCSWVSKVCDDITTESRELEKMQILGCSTLKNKPKLQVVFL